MAFGDPMILSTIYNGGVAQTNFDSLLIDGPMDDGLTGTSWLWNTSVATPAISNQAGTRTAGAGSNFHRLTFTTPGTGDLGEYYQQYSRRGHAKLDGFGHKDQSFSVSFWVRRNDATSGSVTATAQVHESVVLVSSGTPQVLATGTWYNLTASRTLTSTSSTIIQAQLDLSYGGGGGGSPVIDIDEAQLNLAYTFAVNAAVPDEPRLIAPGRSLQRSPGGGLIVHRANVATPNKYEYTLHFGLIGLAQLKTLRSLWLLDSPMTWQPNLPHLPTYLDVRFTGDFNLRMKSPSVNSNNYYGTLTLAEI